MKKEPGPSVLRAWRSRSPRAFALSFCLLVTAGLSVPGLFALLLTTKAALGLGASEVVYLDGAGVPHAANHGYSPPRVITFRQYKEEKIAEHIAICIGLCGSLCLIFGVALLYSGASSIAAGQIGGEGKRSQDINPDG